MAPRYYDPIEHASRDLTDSMVGAVDGFMRMGEDLPRTMACCGCLLVSVGFGVATLLAGCIALVIQAFK